MVRPAERSIKGFNDLHAAAAARARWWCVFWVAVVVVIIDLAIYRRSGHSEQASAEYELVGATAVSQKAIVTNAMEAIR